MELENHTSPHARTLQPPPAATVPMQLWARSVAPRPCAPAAPQRWTISHGLTHSAKADGGGGDGDGGGLTTAIRRDRMVAPWPHGS